MKFFSEVFPLVFVLFGEFLNQYSNTTRFTSKYNITLQTNASLPATREPLLLTSEHNITLQTNDFIASDECVLCWRRTLMMLETNLLRAGDKHVGNIHSNFSQRLPNRT